MPTGWGAPSTFPFFLHLLVDFFTHTQEAPPMRRQSVASSKQPTITLTVPGTRELDARSTSAASSQDNATEAASTTYGGQQVSGWDTAADYKDTVMFLAQQQSMQNREILELLRVISSTLPSVHAAKGAPTRARNDNDGAVSPNGPVDDSFEEPRAFVSSHDHQLQRFTDFGRDVADPSAIKDLTLDRLGGYTGSQSSWFQSVSGVEIELHAAKSRIGQLENINKLLQKQLEQKEETIKRLTNANISALSSRVTAATPTKTPTKSSPMSAWHMDQSTTPGRGAGKAVSPSLHSVLMKHCDKPTS